MIAAVRVLEGEIKGELHDYVIHNLRDVMWELRKDFVTHIQQILDPECYNQEIARLIQRSEKQAENQVKELLGEDVCPGATILVRLVVERLRNR